MAKLTPEQMLDMGVKLVDAHRVLKLRDLMAECIETMQAKGLREEATYAMKRYKEVENEVLQYTLLRIDNIACNLMNANTDEPYYDI